jgi:pyruvate dehydrogenase E2 component (dihydrolipoamide acetyltransferase)
MIEFKLPSLGADMDEGTLLEWRVAPGEHVRRGQVVAVVDTTKAAVDVEIWRDGVVQELLVQPGATVPVGTVLALLRAPDEAAAGGLEVAPGPAIEAVGQPSGPGVAPAVAPAVAPTLVPALATPGAMASGTAAPGRRMEIRKAIAAAMSRSKREIPHYYMAEPVPMARALDWLAQRNAALPVQSRILPAALQLKAVALALRRVPQLNGWFREGAFEPAGAAHLGVAIALRGGGLVAPALLDVAGKALEPLMRELADLVRRARAGSLRSSEMSEPGITVTNLGDQAVRTVFGVIHPPQVALVGFGSIALRPWVEDKEPAQVRALPVMDATLAADHRVTDGQQGAQFLAELRDLLQQPQALDAPAQTTPP